MNTALILTTLIVITGSAFGGNPIEVSNDGGLPPLDLKNTGLTTSYCAMSGYECVSSDIEPQQFASTVSQCLSRCNRNTNCVTAFFDKDKICHLRNKRCDKADLNSNAGGWDLFRLQEKESCPKNRPKYVEPNYNFANRFCKAANKACTGRNLYDKPQNISPFDECLKKCAKITSCFGVDYYDGKCEPKEYQCKDAELIATKGNDNYLRLTNDATSCPGNREDPSKNPPAIETLPTCKNAVNKAAATQQSSIGWDGQSDRAVDGNTDGAYAHNSCSHTDIEKEPWWYADLCRQVTLFGVMITNRDSYQDRLTSIDVGVTNYQPPEDFPESDRAVFRLGAFTGTLKLKFKTSRTGRYLVIVLRKEEFLTLCEVQWATSAAELNGFIDGDDVVQVRQSSIGWNGYPERALDGNPDGNYDHQSCAHTLADNEPWWYVEFQSELTIYGVMISNRDSFQPRLSSFEVAVTNSDPPQNYPSSDVGVHRIPPFTGTLKLKLKSPKKGKYLVVKLRKQEFLTLCEVQWVTSAAQVTDFIDGDNLVRVKQSSQWSDGGPDRAVDGNTDGNFDHKSCAHTNGDDEPWWFVEFINPLTIYGVMITGRDINQYTLENFEVAVTNSEPPQNYPRSDVGVYRTAMFSGTLKLKLKTEKTGRYLVVKMRRQNVLVLCEVQWVTSARELTGFIDGDNVDKFIKARQSSQWTDGNPERAVDGNTDGNYEHHSCSHTNADSPGPWWYADLVNKAEIFGVIISNRDSNQNRLKDFEVAVTNSEPPQNYARKDVGAYHKDQFTGTLKLKFPSSKTGRYLVVHLRYKESLTLCEIQWMKSDADVIGFVNSDTIPD